MMKVNKWILFIIAALIVLLNVIGFAVPFNRNAAFWVCDIFACAALMVQALVFYIAFRKGTNARSIFFGWPIAQIGLWYLGAALLVSAVIIILNFFVKVPAWVALVIHCVLLVVAMIGIIAAEGSRGFVESQDAAMKQRKVFFRELQQQSADLTGMFKDDEVRAKMASLNDKFRYSDPNTAPGLEVIEEDLRNELAQLRVLAGGDRQAALEEIERIERLLDTRNRRCLELKQYR